MSGYSGQAGVSSVNGLTGTITYLGDFHNRIVNPSGQINQTGVGTQADGSIEFDQWYVLTQTASVTSSQLTAVENSTPYMMRITQSQAAAQRFGRIQHLENLNSTDLRGQTVTLSARVRMSASTTLRYAIIEWTGTGDAVTKDVVLDWTSSTFTTSNFFIATTTTIAATGSTALTANTLTTVSLSATISGSATNVAVFFWTDSTQAQNVTFDVGKVQLEIGSAATALAYRGYVAEVMLCRRYCYKTYQVGTLPAAVTNDGAIGGVAPGTVAQRPFITVSFPVPMASAAPSVTYYSPVTGTSGKMANISTSLDVDANTYNVSSSGVTSYPSGTPALGDAVFYHFVATARI